MLIFTKKNIETLNCITLRPLYHCSPSNLKTCNAHDQIYSEHLIGVKITNTKLNVDLNIRNIIIYNIIIIIKTHWHLGLINVHRYVYSGFALAFECKLKIPKNCIIGRKLFKLDRHLNINLLLRLPEK